MTEVEELEQEQEDGIDSADADEESDDEEEEAEEEGQPRVSSRKKQWATLAHNGVVFPEPYKSDPRTNILFIKGDKINMNLAQEEMAVAWAKKIGTPYVEDPIFQQNFLSDFLKLFHEKYKNAGISDIVFPTLPEKVELTKEQKKALAAERKKKRLELKEKYGYALVDGVRTEIANWVVEPPGLFMGRGCVSGDTIVKAINGPKYVQELVANEMIATHHGSSKMFYKPVHSIAPQGVRTLLNLRTRTHSIRATSNHPFLTLRIEKVPRRNENGNFTKEKFPASLKWINLSDLKKGDYVVTVKRYQTPGTTKYSNTPSRTVNGMIVTPKLARLLGYYLGDGYISRRSNSVGSVVSFSEDHQKLVDRYTKICEEVFGLVPDIVRHPPGNSWVLQVFSTEFASAIQSLGVTGTALTKRVPAWVFGLADDLKCALIRGYADADGAYFVNRVNGIQYSSFGFESPNRRLIEDFRELAISASLQVSNLTTRDRHGYSSSKTYRFFVSEYKSVCRLLLDEGDILEGSRSKFNSFDTRSNSLRAKWDWSRLQVLDSELFCLEKVLSIKEAGKAQTYDVSMAETSDPNFIADGFVVHNSHPLRGHWKPRVMEEDVTLNLDENAPNPENKKWKIVHQPECMWIACWTDKLADKVKYVWLHDSSSIRQMRDKSKYDKAQKLEKDIRKVESYILKSMKSKDPKERKIATACFLIYRLAMRVGDEKDEDEADTVGASTLRVEHLIFARQNAVDFDFFGKDYVRWQKTLEVSPSESVAIDNLREFCKGKKPDDLIFDGITSRHVNDFFGRASPGLTAKVFRTFLATTVVKDYLKIHNKFLEGTPEHEKIYEARLANLEAALKCNHKRTPPKTFEQTLQKKKERLAQLEQSTVKTDKQKERLKIRIAKLRKQIELTEQTRDYNLNTSLRNYIDPRVFKTWADRIGLDWKVLYTTTLQRKMAWVDGGSGISVSEGTKPREQDAAAGVRVQLEKKQ